MENIGDVFADNSLLGHVNTTPLFPAFPREDVYISAEMADPPTGTTLPDDTALAVRELSEQIRHAVKESGIEETPVLEFAHQHREVLGGFQRNASRGKGVILTEAETSLLSELAETMATYRPKTVDYHPQAKPLPNAAAAGVVSMRPPDLIPSPEQVQYFLDNPHAPLPANTQETFNEWKTRLVPVVAQLLEDYELDEPRLVDIPDLMFYPWADHPIVTYSPYVAVEPVNGRVEAGFVCTSRH